MSTSSIYKNQEEILSLKNLISDTLARKGVLGKLKAELRASVFSVLQQQQQKQVQQQSANSKLNGLKGSREGRLMLDLISEFLDFYDLKYTSSVFTAETGLNDRFDPSLRRVIIQEINLYQDTPLSDEPLLFSLLRQFEQKSKSSMNNKSNSNINLARSRESLSISPKMIHNRRAPLDDEKDRILPPKQNIDLLPPPKSLNSSHEFLSRTSLSSSSSIGEISTGVSASNSLTAVANKPLFSSKLEVPQVSPHHPAPSQQQPQQQVQSVSNIITVLNAPGVSQTLQNQQVDVLAKEPKSSLSSTESIDQSILDDIPEDIPDDTAQIEDLDMDDDDDDDNIDVSQIPPPSMAIGVQPQKSQGSSDEQLESERNKTDDINEYDLDFEEVKSDVTESLEELLEPSVPNETKTSDDEMF